jgi:PPOX class probable F420-dependent enzyme|tara:strand:- start:2324 stop:2785 length:462 start_codon:yes stop_codon:yes gene_type:complete
MKKNLREKIRMDAEEIAEFIEEQKSLQVGTINSDGSIHLSTLWFAVVDDLIVFETYTSSQKVVNLERDPRITVLLEDGLEYNNLRGVMIKGVANLVSEPTEVKQIAREVIKRNQPEIPDEMLDDAAASLAVKRTVVTVVPEKVVSWDHRKISS